MVSCKHFNPPQRKEKDGMADLLNDVQKSTALQKLDGWNLHGERDALAKTFKFNDFNTAFSWMTRVAMNAEKMGHHPEWFNVYNKIEVVLATHSANGVTQLDIDLARFMDATS